MYFSPAGVTAANYVSYTCSPYHIWFEEMGYPLLDIVVYEDQEWSVIEYQSMPIVPSITKWKVILQGMRNIEITPHFVKRQVESMDLARQEAWEREELKSKAVADEHEAVEKHREESAERCRMAVANNPYLMERIARDGVSEMDLTRIVRHIPRYKL